MVLGLLLVSWAGRNSSLGLVQDGSLGAPSSRDALRSDFVYGRTSEVPMAWRQCLTASAVSRAGVMLMITDFEAGVLLISPTLST
jgi:hypothetical protein